MGFCYDQSRQSFAGLSSIQCPLTKLAQTAFRDASVKSQTSTHDQSQTRISCWSTTEEHHDSVKACDILYRSSSISRTFLNRPQQGNTRSPYSGTNSRQREDVDCLAMPIMTSSRFVMTTDSRERGMQFML